MNFSEIFLAAAEEIAEGRFYLCCMAITSVVGDFEWDSPIAFFSEWFKPEVPEGTQEGAWWVDSDIESRIYALLFAAIITEETANLPSNEPT